MFTIFLIFICLICFDCCFSFFVSFISLYCVMYCVAVFLKILFLEVSMFLFCSRCALARDGARFFFAGDAMPPCLTSGGLATTRRFSAAGFRANWIRHMCFEKEKMHFFHFKAHVFSNSNEKCTCSVPFCNVFEILGGGIFLSGEAA